MKLDTIYEDAVFTNSIVPEGYLLVFLGYSTGAAGGDIVKRYKNHAGEFGTLAGGTAGMTDEEANIIINESLSVIENVSDEVNTLLIEANNISKQLDNILGIESNIPDDDTGNGDSGNEELNQTPLTFRKDPSETGTATMSLTIGSTIASSVNIWYKTSTADWSEYTSGSSIELVDTSDYVMFWNKSSTASTGTDTADRLQFIIKNGKIQASGNIDSMCNFSALSNYCYRHMFYDCTALTTAPELPATELAYSCYSAMFYNCTSLVEAPELPAITLADYCYGSMFHSCTSLTTAPELPATKLATQCYGWMFHSCTSLTTAPELPATTLANNCYWYMFHGCTSLTTAPELPATTLADYCYHTMFQNCTSLTQAPAELPATELAVDCYYAMFRGCTSLTQAPAELPATELAIFCYYEMFYGCTSLTTAPELPATELATLCYYKMFHSCTSLTTAPELPATTLADNCYLGMFCDCTKLNYISVEFTAWNPSNATAGWVEGVASSGTFVCPGELTEQRGISYIPGGWTVINED